MTLASLIRFGFGAAAIAAIAVASHAQPAPKPPGKQPAKAKEAPAPAAKIETAAELLDALEASDATLRTFQSHVVYDKRFELQGDQHIRTGHLYFSSEPGDDPDRPRRRFAVSFDTLQLDGAKRPERQALIFDGEWLVEVRESEKQWVARQLAPPGAPIDPLRVGEGPLPIPFGQPSAEILARFDAELLAAEEGIAWEELGAANYGKYVTGAWQLLLTPMEGTPEAEKFREIRLWYAPDGSGRILPRLAFTIDRKGDQSFVQLVGAKVNAPLPAGVIDMTEPDISEGWTVQREFGRFDDAPVEPDARAPEEE
jgi:hypothetical protein